MVDRVLSELADDHGLRLVIDDLHELHSPEALDLLSACWRTFPPMCTRC